jgi:hypothetical protein
MAIPLIIAGAAAATAGIAGGAVNSAVQEGANDYEGSEFSGWGNADRMGRGTPLANGRYFKDANYKAPTSGFDQNRYEYGGRTGMADQQANYYKNQAEQAQWREGAQADYAMTNEDRARALAMRGQQEQALDLQRQAALGQAPSVAQQQMQAGLDQAMRSQESMRASARGASGLALADYNAAANVAQQQQVGVQSSILRAQEMAQARDAYQAGATGIRGMDYSAAGQAAGMAQYQADAQMKQREMNDRYALGLYGASEGVRAAQMQGNLQQQSAMLNAYLENQRLYQAREAGQAAAAGQSVAMGLGGISGGITALASAYGNGSPTQDGGGKGGGK